MKHLALLLTLLCSIVAFAETPSFLPGGPNPNKGVRENYDKDTTLLDDRKGCGSGEKLFQEMECQNPNYKLECQHYEPVLKCRSKANKPKCSEPKVLKPKYRCVPTGASV